MVEHFHKQLKAAVRFHETENWTEILSTVLIGIRGAWNEDLNTTVAEIVFDEPIRLPGQFLTPTSENDDSTVFIARLRRHMSKINPTQSTRHSSRKTFVFKGLASCSHVFVRTDGSKRALQQPYEGPYPVINRHNEFYTVSIRGRRITVSIDRFKLAYIPVDDDKQTTEPRSSGKEVTSSTTRNEPHAASSNTEELKTRPLRRIRFPDRYQAGFS